MIAARVGLTIDADLLHEVDQWVADGEFSNRSRAVQAGLLRLREERGQYQTLLRELVKLDPAEERALAEEWIQGEVPSARS